MFRGFPVAISIVSSLEYLTNRIMIRTIILNGRFGVGCEMAGMKLPGYFLEIAGI
jgi:hypothetical protein